MGENIEISKLKYSRIEKLDRIINILSKEITRIDDINIVLEEIDKIIECIHKINEEIAKSSPRELYDKEYENKLTESINRHRIFIDQIQKKKESIYSSIEQTGKRNKVLQNYVGKSYNSIFIDKNL